MNEQELLARLENDADADTPSGDAARQVVAARDSIASATVRQVERVGELQQLGEQIATLQAKLAERAQSLEDRPLGPPDAELQVKTSQVERLEREARLYDRFAEWISVDANLAVAGRGYSAAVVTPEINGLLSHARRLRQDARGLRDAN